MTIATSDVGRRFTAASVSVIAALLIVLASPMAFSQQTSPLQQSVSETNSPGLRADQANFNFGNLQSEDDIRHTFRLTNTGKTPISIRQAIAGAPFLVIERFPQVLTAGEASDLNVKVIGEQAPSFFDAIITLRSDDPNHPELELHVSGRKASMVNLTPASIDFGMLAADSHEMRMVTIKSVGNKPMHATLKSKGGNGFAFDLVETVANLEYTLIVYATTGNLTGSLHDVAVITTDLPQEPELRVPVSYLVAPHVTAVPPVIFVDKSSGAISASQQPRKFVHLVNRGPQFVSLKETSCDNPRIKLHTTEIKPGRMYRIDLEFPFDFNPDANGARVTVKTDDVSQPVVSVAVQSQKPSVTPPSVAKAGTANQAAPRKATAASLEGKPVPDFHLEAIAGGPSVSKEEISNWPITVLNFVAPSCGYCKRQLPQLEKVRVKYEPLGVRFVNISQNMGPPVTPEQAVAAYSAVGSKISVAMDVGNRTGQLFNANSYPTLFIAAADGRIHSVITGAKANMEQLMTEKLEAIFGGADTPGVDQGPTNQATSAPAKK